MKLIQILSQISISEDQLDIPKSGSQTSDNLASILSVVFGILGGVALVIIVYAGIQFMLSRGEPQKAATARATIIYAAIGLAVAVSAFTIVRFTVSIL